MTENADLTTGLTITFPDPKTHRAKRIREFQQLSSTQRLLEISSLIAFGLKTINESPHRAAIERSWQKREDEFQQIQRKLFERYQRDGNIGEPITKADLE